MSQNSTRHTTPDHTTTAAASTGAASTGKFTFADALGRMESLTENMRVQYQSIVNWENVVKSSVVVMSINIVLLIFWLLEIDLFTLFIYTVILLLGAGYPISKFSNLGKSISQDSNVTIFSKQAFDKHANTFYTYLNQSAARTRSIFLWKDTRESLFVIGGLFLTACLAPLFSVGWAIFFAANGVLLQKPAVENYMRHVHPQAKPYLLKAKAAVNQVVAKLPAGVDGSKSKKI